MHDVRADQAAASRLRLLWRRGNVAPPRPATALDVNSIVAAVVKKLKQSGFIFGASDKTGGYWWRKRW